MSEEKVCAHCGHSKPTAPVAGLFVFAPGLPDNEPCFPLLPSEDYPLCDAEPDGKPCPSLRAFTEKAIKSHPATRGAGPWTVAVVVFKDPDRPPWHYEQDHHVARA